MFVKTKKTAHIPYIHWMAPFKSSELLEKKRNIRKTENARATSSRYLRFAPESLQFPNCVSSLCCERPQLWKLMNFYPRVNTADHSIHPHCEHFQNESKPEYEQNSQHRLDVRAHKIHSSPDHLWYARFFVHCFSLVLFSSELPISIHLGYYINNFTVQRVSRARAFYTRRHQQQQ